MRNEKVDNIRRLLNVEHALQVTVLSTLREVALRSSAPVTGTPGLPDHASIALGWRSTARAPPA